MPTRPQYLQLLIFLYLEYVTSYRSGFALVTRYPPTTFITYRHMTTPTLMYRLLPSLVLQILHVYHQNDTISNTLPVSISIGCGVTQPHFYATSGVWTQKFTMSGNNLLRNQTAMPTRPRFPQLSIFCYLFCVFFYHSGFALVPRYLHTAGLTHPHMIFRPHM